MLELLSFPPGNSFQASRFQTLDAEPLTFFSACHKKVSRSCRPLCHSCAIFFTYADLAQLISSCFLHSCTAPLAATGGAEIVLLSSLAVREAGLECPKLPNRLPPCFLFLLAAVSVLAAVQLFTLCTALFDLDRKQLVIYHGNPARRRVLRTFTLPALGPEQSAHKSV